MNDESGESTEEDDVIDAGRGKSETERQVADGEKGKFILETQ